jgi:hypothetical protein
MQRTGKTAADIDRLVDASYDRIHANPALVAKADDGLTPAEHTRREMIRDRNRRRRYPWILTASAIATGQVAHWISDLATRTTGSPSHSIALTTATIPPIVAACIALYHRPASRQWLPDLTLNGLIASGTIYWTATTGLSWPIILASLIATTAGCSRWWKAHPIGPGVPRLEAPQPPQEPAPAPTASEPDDTDPYCIAWNDNNAGGDGRAKGSRLTGRSEGKFTVDYDVELKRGSQTINDLLANRAALASGLGEDVDRVLFKRAPRGQGAHRAQLTIITKDPVAETRYYTGPQVEGGVIKNVARFIDGAGDIDVTMWDDGGTVQTMVVGSTGGGKSAAANILTCGALSTGVMNLLYADPKGNSSTALATRARVAVIGHENVLKLSWLVTTMLKAREQIAAMLGADQIFPSAEVPGWMFLHDEYSLIANDSLAQQVWTKTVNIVRAYGIWAVALNQSQGQPQWGSDHARSAFASQVIAFRTNSKSGSDLVPGLNFDPNELPVDEKGRPVPGMAVHAHYDTPTRWDHLPSEANADRMAENGQPAPPYTTNTAFDAFFRQPDPANLDRFAIEAVLGPPVNGRWQVGGLDGTHEFPEDIEELKEKLRPNGRPQAKQKGRWGHRGTNAASTPQQLTPAQTEVLSIVRSGTTATSDILTAADAKRSTVLAALSTLKDRGLIRKSAHGTYEPAPGI